MAVKNAIPCDFYVVPSWNGYSYANYPTGNKPSGYVSAPTILDTDVLAGSLTGFEDNNGCYVRIFGYNLGLQSRMGLATGARVYFRDPLGDNAWHEVANYRALNESRTFTVNQVQRLIVQIGSLGGAQTAGRALDMKITVNGVDTNILTGQFTIQPGRCAYVSPTGDDATGLWDDITKPFRYAQYTTGGGGTNSYTGIWAATTAMGETGLRAGDTICLLAGTYSDQVGFDLRFIRFRSHTGTAPNGTVGNGYISITAYGGAIGANAPAVVTYNDPASGKGFLHGVNTAYSGTYGQYVTVSGFVVTASATSVSDAGCVNLQSGANTWRVIDNELGPWPSTLASPGNAKAGGVAGQGYGVVIKFNYIHDIDCDINNINHDTGVPGENHGIYAGDAAGFLAKNWDVSYNWIKDILGGSAFQCNNNAVSPPEYFENILVHHNFFDNSMKYSVNFNNSTLTASVYNNVLLDAHRNCVRIGDALASASVVINITYNTIRQLYTYSTSYPILLNNEGAAVTNGAWKFVHNIVVKAGASITAYTNWGAGDTALTMTRNLYFDELGVLTSAPAKDATGVYGNPNFTSTALRDFTCLAGGAGLNQATGTDPIAVTTDLYGMTRPQTVTNDIGATEGIGT